MKLDHLLIQNDREVAAFRREIESLLDNNRNYLRPRVYQVLLEGVLDGKHLGNMLLLISNLTNVEPAQVVGNTLAQVLLDICTDKRS